MAHVKTTKVSKERQEELLGMKLQMAFSELEDEEIAACLQEGLNPKEEIIEAADYAMERIESVCISGLAVAAAAVRTVKAQKRN